GDARCVIDADVQELPAHPAGSLPPVPVDPVPAPLDAAQLLRVQVQQLARALLLVADDLGPRLQRSQPAEAQPPEPQADRRDREGELRRDPKARVPPACAETVIT